jgi:hypothetical protein
MEVVILDAPPNVVGSFDGSWLALLIWLLAVAGFLEGMRLMLAKTEVVALGCVVVVVVIVSSLLVVVVEVAVEGFPPNVAAVWLDNNVILVDNIDGKGVSRWILLLLLADIIELDFWEDVCVVGAAALLVVVEA